MMEELKEKKVILSQYKSNSKLLKITGDDALVWLNGLVTQDVLKGKGEDVAQYAFFLSENGKILTDAWITSHSSSEVFALVGTDHVQKLVEHLERYIIMEDVEVETWEGTHVMFVARDRAQFEGLFACCKRMEQENSEQLTLFYASDWLGLGLGVDIFFQGNRESEAREKVKRYCGEIEITELDMQQWDNLRVQRGMPKYGVDFGDFTLAQETGFKERAVSFNKGCYLGQESVVMLEHRGKPTKRLVQVSCSENLSYELLPSPFFVVDKNNTRMEIGQLTSIASTEEGNAAGIGHVKRGFVEEGLEVECGERMRCLLSRVIEWGPVDIDK